MKSTDQKKTFRADTESVRKLTRSAQRKLTVTCIAVAAIALILFGAGMGYFNRRDSGSENASFEEMENSLKGQMQEDMAEASAYLKKLDDSIAENQKKLDAVKEQLTARQEALLVVETTQKRLEENASDVSVNMKELEKRTEAQINALQRNMDSVRTDIRSTLDRIPFIIATCEKNAVNRKADSGQSMSELAKVDEAILEIDQSIYRVEMNLRQSYENLNTMLKELRASEEKNQSELVQQLSDVEANLKALLEADMAQITMAFINLSSELQDQVSGLSQHVDGGFETLDQNMSDSFINLDQNVSGGFADLGQNVSGGFADLGQNVSGGFADLDQNVSDSFANLSQNMDGGFENLGQDVNHRFQEMNQTILMQYADLISSSEQNNVALIAYLDALDSALRQDLDAALDQIRNAISNIEQKLDTGAEEVPEPIGYEYLYRQDVDWEYPHAEKSATPAAEETGIWEETDIVDVTDNVEEINTVEETNTTEGTDIDTDME